MMMMTTMVALIQRYYLLSTDRISNGRTQTSRTSIGRMVSVRERDARFGKQLAVVACTDRQTQTPEVTSATDLLEAWPNPRPPDRHRHRLKKGQHEQHYCKLIVKKDNTSNITAS